MNFLTFHLPLNSEAVSRGRGEIPRNEEQRRRATRTDDKLLDESSFKVRDILKNEGGSILYEYDFGDGWLHKVGLEQITPFEKGQFLPLCLKGKRACPSEDVGGIHGYMDFVEKWQDESNPEHVEVRDWVGDNFLGPEYFDLVKTNEYFHDFFSGV